MRILVRFADNEVMEAESDAVNTDRLGFPVRPTEGNNRLAWVAMTGIKYATFPDAGGENAPLGDPREVAGQDKLVIRFLDGEVIRAYRDDAFSHQGHGFLVRIWDADKGRLVRAVISVYALKAIFTVEKWDSRGVDHEPGGRAELPPQPVAKAASPSLALAPHPAAIGLPGGSFPGQYLR